MSTELGDIPPAARAGIAPVGGSGPPTEDPVPVRPVAFALTPAQAVRDLYDYNTTKDAKIYKMATDSLLTKHDGTISTLRPMLDELLLRVKDFNWTSLISILDDDGKPCNIILQNRALSIENIISAATPYLGTHTRMAQDNYMMVQCILNSLDTDGAKALRSSQYSYTHGTEPCAALLVKVLLLDCEVETASTNFYVRAQLGDLEQFMVSIDYDVIAFNKHVSELLRKLRQGGEESHDDVLFIYMHVMRAYLICPDSDFLLAIKLQKIKAEADPKLLTLPTLMIVAQKTYQTLLQEGTYNAPQSHESRLVALAAKYGTLNVKGNGNAKGKGKEKDRAKKPEWMNKAPTDGILTKTVDGKIYHFCTYHKRWGFHKEVDCYVRMRQVQNTTSNDSSVRPPPSSAGSVTSDSQRLTMSAAIAAVLDDDEDNSSYAAFPSLLSAASTTIPSLIACNSSVTSFDSDSFTILVDNGASRCMTNNSKHFVGEPRAINKTVTGLGAGAVTLEGTVRWSWEDDHGTVHTMDIPNTLYCSSLAYCLLSPQHLATELKDNAPVARGTWLATYDDAMVLQWGQRQHQRTIPLSSTNAFVGIMRSAPGFRKSTMFLNLCALTLPNTPLCFPAPLFNEETNPSALPVAPSTSHLDASDDETYNWVLQADPIRQDPLRFDFYPEQSDEPQTHQPAVGMPSDTRTPPSVQDDPDDVAKHDLLRLHHRLGHMSFTHIRELLKTQTGSPARLMTCPLPVCSACLFGKAVKRAWRVKGSSPTLKVATHPGHIVSVDQLESSTPGLIAHCKGHPTTKRFTCATVFVDHFSRLTYLNMQESNGAVETLAAKHAFELFARGHNVAIQHYHGDNGRFADNAFRIDCSQKGQTLSFCGVNAHFQNGIAERKIRDLQDRARTMLIHAKHRWPNAITSNLWPYALRLANESSRCIPIRDSRNPMQLFTGHDFQIATHQHLHPFGCPIYVLKNEPASGKKGSKWGERARCGIYLGLSPEHARSVCLVLSLTSGLVSAQFHVRADENFETITSSSPPGRSGTSTWPPVYHSQWQQKHGFTTNSEDLLARTRNHRGPGAARSRPIMRPRFQADTPVRRPNITRPTTRAPNHPINRHPQVQHPTTAHAPKPTASRSADTAAPANDSDSDDDPPASIARVDIADAYVPNPLPPPIVDLPGGPAAVVTPLPVPVPTRARRTIRPPRRLIAQVATTPVGPPVVSHIFNEHPDTFLRDLGEYVIQDSLSDPIAFSASTDPDTMYLHEARRQPDWPQFQLAMQEEVRAHEDRKHWKLIRRSALPVGVSVLPSVWSMKRKRRIATREIYKWKARLTAHGGKQVHGVNFWETYAPVVNWTSIRLHLILALLNGHHTRQIDFVLAYPQADIECDMYMEIPQGFHHEGQRRTHVLQLLKNIYGTRQAGRVWNKHIHAGLIERGYRQSSVDHCVYYKGNTVFLLYVDDGIFIGPDAKEIDDLILSLKRDTNYTTSYDITDEGTLSDYLGVKIDHLEGGRMRLSQPHLIQQILNDIGFKDNTKPKRTPAPSTTILHRDTDGPDFEEEWAYRSVVGKLNFLEKSTRGDLSYAVHQCARFSANPKHSHAEAIRHIGRYLVGTKDKGIILNPTTASFDCYVDADFCGTWNPDTAEGDSSTSKSRTGYVIKYAGCPIVWQSKLQTETALSTTEAEYVALSSALREVICLMELLKEAQRHGIPNVATNPRIHCKVFEDNSGALTMAQVPKMRPRTKHLNVKYHHFRDHVARGEISLYPVTSANQEADIYTKPLPTTLFSRLRLAILGW